MNSSKEGLIEMTELTSPARKPGRLKLKKSNQIHSPPFASPTRSTDRDVTILFSVKKPDQDTETISELSDDDLSSDNSLKNLTSTSELLIASGKGTTHMIRSGKLKKSLERIKQESTQVDANIKSIRDKFQLEEARAERPEMSFFKFDQLGEAEQDDLNSHSQYMPPENLGFNLKMAEKACFLVANNSGEFDKAIIASPLTGYSLKPRLTRGDCTSYCPPNRLLTNNGIEEVVVIKDNNVLELSLYHVQFLHHPLFSLEHVLQEKLKRVFGKYSKIVENRRVDTLMDELRNCRGNVTAKELRKLRENLFREGKNQRESLKLILNVWRAIKRVRSQQKYSSTTVRLIIKKEKSNLSLEKEQYNQLFQEILQDVLSERQQLKASEKEGEALTLRDEFDASFKPPDEPHLVLYLEDDHVITTDVADARENDRRQVMSTTKFTLKILCNDVPVCKSKPLSLTSNDFTLDVNELFAIQLTNVPQFLCLEIFEHPQGLLKKKIAELNVDIPPSPSVLYKDAPVSQKRFERREIAHYKHAGVGSGYSLKKMLEDNELSLVDLKLDAPELYTKGIVAHRIGWQGSQAKSLGGDENGATDVLSATRCFIDKWGALNELGLHTWLEGQDMEELKRVGFDAFLDENSTFSRELLLREDGGHFRLSPYINEMVFCKPEALQRNVRLQYLKLRDQNEVEFDGLAIPNRIREIPLGLLKDFKKRKALEALRDEEEDPDELREGGKRRLAQIHSRVFHTCKGLRDNLSYESVVNEKYLIYLEDLIRISLKNFINWFRWRPKLIESLPRLLEGPVRAQAQEAKTPQPQQYKLRIRVLAGKNLPERKEEAQAFLEINYDEFFARTSSVAGSEPVWNELVELPLQYRHADYLNPEALNGSISVSLFDTTKGTNDIKSGGNEKFWLGEARIPMAALTTPINLCGWFRIVKPAVLLGHSIEQQPGKSPKHTNNHHQEISSEETYVQLDLSVSPSIPWLEPNMRDLPSNDTAYIRDHVIKWNELFDSNFPNKKFNVLALDTKGRTNCITRYIRPLEPPQLNNEEFDVTPEQCLRYVSQIPFTECNHFYQNVWLTSDQLLSFMIGSVVDHCVTLTCFLLALKMDAYLLLGYGIPHGITSYVLLSEYTRDSVLPNYYIFDVFYNEKFYLGDPLCPLQRVFCILNGENVWGNAQRTQSPALLRFDLRRRSDWWPLFNDALSAPTNFVNNKINFASAQEFEVLERQLERKLKRKFSKWRPMERTNFNHRVSEIYRSGLKYFEMNAMYGRSNSEAAMEICRAASQYNVVGTILNVPFTGVNAVVKKIKGLNLHVQQQGITDFGLGVFVQSYPGQVLSVWVFIGAIVDRLSS